MSPQAHLELTTTVLLPPFLVALALIGAMSLLREPSRQKFSAIFLAGAGAAYLSGGFGIFEFGFCGVITYLAYRGLENYRAIGFGWVLHTCWDIAHHYYGNPRSFVDGDCGRRGSGRRHDPQASSTRIESRPWL